MSLPIGSDLGQYITSAFGGCTNNSGAPSLITADDATDGVEYTGATVDRHSSVRSCIANSAVVTVPYVAALSIGESFSALVTVQDSADGSTWSNAVTLYSNSAQESGGDAGGNFTGIIEINDALLARKRYIRYNVTFDMSQVDSLDVSGNPVDAVDTSLFAVVVTLGGYSTGSI